VIQPAHHPHFMVTQKVAVVSVCRHHHVCPIPAHAHIGAIMPQTAVADDWCWGAEAEGEPIAGDGRCSTQGAAEY